MITDKHYRIDWQDDALLVGLSIPKPIDILEILQAPKVEYDLPTL